MSGTDIAGALLAPYLVHLKLKTFHCHGHVLVARHLGDLAQSQKSIGN